MLRRDEAQEQLKRLAVPDWTERKLKAFGTLSAERTAGKRLIDPFRPPERRGSMTDTINLIRNALIDESAAMAAQLDRMTPAQFRRLLDGLFPKIAPYVEGAWNSLKAAPYQPGFARRGFRAPNDPSVTSLARMIWLRGLCRIVGPYDEDVEWLAAWAGHLPQGPLDDHWIPPVLAAAIDSGGPVGQRVLEILMASGRGDHEVGVMGRHVVQSLLLSARPDAWEFVENMLLAAQREEGLRQVILESVDFTHPESFRRMLRLILENNLVRFSATVRAADVWFGFMWESTNAGVVQHILERALALLESKEEREAALAGDNPEEAYLALWACGIEDAPATIPRAAALLDRPDPEMRFAGAFFLLGSNLTTARPHLNHLLNDSDPRLAAYALQARLVQGPGPKEEDVVPALEELFERAPEKPSKPKPLVWPWCVFPLQKKDVCAELFRCSTKSPKRMLKYVRFMDPSTRHELAKQLGGHGRDTQVRSALLELAGDPSPYVREAAIKSIAQSGAIAGPEALVLEGYLTRKASDLRRGVLSLLLKQDNARALASADRLLVGRSEDERGAGMELLRLLIEAKRSPEACRQRMEERKESEAPLSHREEAQIEAAVGEKAEEERRYNLANGLGLFDPRSLTRPSVPKARPLPVDYEVAARCITSLDNHIGRNRTKTATVRADGLPGVEAPSVREMPLGEVETCFPRPGSASLLEDAPTLMPLYEFWEEWYASRPDKLRDPDGFELLRANLLLTLRDDLIGPKALVAAVKRDFFRTRHAPARDFPHATEAVLRWLAFIHLPEGAPDFLLDCLETLLSMVPPEVALGEEDITNVLHFPWQAGPPISSCIEIIRDIRRMRPERWNEAHDIRLWRLLHWMRRPVFDHVSVKSAIVTKANQLANKAFQAIGFYAPRNWAPSVEEMAAAFRAGAIHEGDVFDHLFVPLFRGMYAANFQALQQLTRAKEDPVLKTTPGLRELVDRVRDRVLEIELKRGDTATSASPVAMSLGSIRGAEAALRVLQALGKGTLARGYLYNNESRECVFSHLLRVSFPSPEDTPESFARLAKEAGIKDKRLVEFAVYAPQWARYVEAATNQPGFEDAVWWFHAHTKDPGWHVDPQVLEWWSAQVTERTPLTAQDLLDGAVDVEWFRRAYGTLGDDGWKKAHDAAKYASRGAGHARARLFADAMLGRVTAKELSELTLGKRQQDAARSLGLVPLPEDPGVARAEVLKRYETLQEFLRTGRKAGSQRQASEKRAAAIGMDNLARTAGYPDPVRLQWAMERMLVADLAQGPVSVTEGDLTVTLSVDVLGVPDIAVEKAGKPIKSVPAALKKHEPIKELLDRKTALRRQVSRMRKSLEDAMCRGDRFSGGELSELLGHPMLAPMLQNLVFVGEGLMGYPIEGGRALRGANGDVQAVGRTDELRIAHPHDFLQAGQWDRWQHDCFAAERVQPFKQVFRELYVLTDTEREDKTLSRRYAGHQVHPRQALALLTGRGWVAHHDEGVRRTFYAEGISAWLEALNPFFTPAEIEGITLESVRFSRPGTWTAMPLEEVPPRVFSEVMRDLDLVVSVAHRGGVDPEASASTLEMRAALLRETLDVLGIDNVRIENRRAIVEGTLSTYSVHLGSAVVHAMPGGMLFILPVGAQHRGRLFLPFADDDPRTAEVLSKVLLLARDSQIKDPNILSQLRGKSGV